MMLIILNNSTPCSCPVNAILIGIYKFLPLTPVNEINSLKLAGVSKVRLEFTTENKREVIDVVDGYNNGELELFGVTNGYY